MEVMKPEPGKKLVCMYQFKVHKTENQMAIGKYNSKKKKKKREGLEPRMNAMKPTNNIYDRKTTCIQGSPQNFQTCVETLGFRKQNILQYR